jgi:hypothetical protein
LSGWDAVKANGTPPMIQTKTALAAVLCFSAVLIPFAAAERPRISEDRELKEIDLSAWDCRDRPEGSGKTPDAIERNRLKNREAAKVSAPLPATMDVAGFLRLVAPLDSQRQGKRRADLSAEQRTELAKYEKQLVSVTGYLVLAYAGPPESTNCGSTDFHDWHLEIFAEPSDHPPEIGDPTPVICEITPRTQNQLFRDGIRMQALAGFIRAPDLSYEPTGHPARKIRVTGNLLWDDDHNGKADVGPTVRSAGANKFHNPWRSTAWEIHPVVKIEVLSDDLSTPAGVSFIPSIDNMTTATPASTTRSAPTQEFVTLSKAVRIKIAYGETVLPRGLKLPLVSRNGDVITVKYPGKFQTIPTDAALPSR